MKITFCQAEFVCFAYSLRSSQLIKSKIIYIQTVFIPIKKMKKRLVYIFLFLIGTTQAQWNPTAPFYPPAEDCPVAMRICDATQEYNFELVGDGLIDDANGSLDLIYLPQTNFTQFESRICFLKFTPQYAGDLALVICPENLERLQFQIFKNYNCATLENGMYSQNTFVASSNITTWSSDMGCMGLGQNNNPYNPGSNSPNFRTFLEPLEVGSEYLLVIHTRHINQTGSHKVTLKFTGPVVSAHPDVFNHPECTMSAPTYVGITATVFPNPFTNSLQIESNTTFKTMELYDVLGKQIFNQKFENQINTLKLAKGVYFLHLITEEGEVLVKKVVKK